MNFPRSFSLSRAAAAAKRCDFLLAPFPASSIATRRVIGKPICDGHCGCRCTVNGTALGSPHATHSCCVLFDAGY